MTELGATQSEIQKAMPGSSEIDAALKRRLAAATAARKQQQNDSGIDERQSRKKAHSGEKLPDSQQDLDLRDTKRLKVF